MQKHYLKDHIPDDLPEKTLHCFDIGTKRLLYIRKNAGAFITQRICPHASADLSSGYLIGSHIICPKHGFKFDISNGKNVSGEGYQLRVYPIHIDSEGEYIELS